MYACDVYFGGRGVRWWGVLWCVRELSYVSCLKSFQQRRIVRVYMFRAIWEFAQSRDCVGHSRNPEIVQAILGLRNTCARSQDRVTHVRNLKIACACSCIAVRPTASDLLCSSQNGRHP